MMIYDNMRLYYSILLFYIITHTPVYWLYKRDNHVILKAYKESLYAHQNDH